MNPDIQRRSRAELLRSAFSNHRAAYLASLLTMGLIALSLRDISDTALMGVFIAWLLLAELGRIGIHLAFSYHGDSRLSLQLQRWEWLFLGGGAITAAGWGFGAWALFPAEGTGHQLALSALVIGVTSITTLAASSHFRFAAGFIVLALTPLALAQMFMATELSLLMAAFTLAIGGLLASIALVNSRNLQELLELRFSYSNMAQDLADEIFAKQETESRLDELAHYDPLTGL